ncbi:flagellar hook-associated protein FlgK [Thiohalobacter sp. COW1]|uniref:flagellar hook-associated protein FlgK n=1 Tax=Thiohalobacter sp. COW1 TaxID=2795687 RepID=UPI001915468F|nr:flagellar hook-associated protein FlgK [Thiohalobacter sp. COW1]BCO31085.1 flagellar hook-associated protein FlgK [Thiohalobacter sp. COW1]
MASGILGTASSALLSFQRALATTGHNIANVNTDGFSRQRVDLSTQTPNSSGAGFIGNGVQIDGVQRSYDDFLERELRSSIGARDSSRTYAEFASVVDNLLADPNSGLSPALQNFFDSIQQVADDPTAIPARELMLSEAESLVASFRHIDGELDGLRERIGIEFRNQVAEINDLADSIASLNEDIALAFGSGTGQPPNDLLDQRDQLVLKLSEKIGVTTLEQSDHTLNVYIGNGQPLVVGQKAGSLSVQRNSLDSQQLDIAFSFGGGGSSLITDKISGGSLGGIIEFRKQVLDPSQNRLGQIAVSLAETFNAQHRIGQDLDGNPGSSLPDFFAVTDPNDQVFSNLTNAGSSSLDVAFDTATIDQLTADEFRLSYNGGTWTLENLTSGATDTITPGTTFTGHGLNIDLSVTGTAVDGDSYLLRPTRQGGNGIAANITNPREIAAAAPVRIDGQTSGTGIPTNTGSGEFSSGTVTGSLPALPITLTYDDTTIPPFFSGGGYSFDYDPTSQSGDTFTAADTGISGLEFTISGTPANTDQFVISANSGGGGDNRNALALAGLQTDRTMNNASASFQDSYGQMIADVGVKTRRAQTLATTQSNLANQAQARHDAVSAVNLDEEAAELLRWQQAYQAAAQVVTISDTIFQTLLQATGR